LANCKNNENNNINNEITTLLTSQAFSNLLSSRNMRIAELDAVIAILIKTKIPFDVIYSPGTRRTAESAELKIYINPTTTLNFVLNFQPGSSIFSGGQI
jgi:hypothetical protein